MLLLQMVSVVVELHNMTRTVQLLRKPDGTRQFPSRSCCDLKEQYSDKESGMDMECALLVNVLNNDSFAVCSFRHVLDRS